MTVLSRLSAIIISLFISVSLISCKGNGGHGNPASPALDDLVVSSSDGSSITIAAPVFSNSGDPSLTAAAYLGIDGNIAVNGSIISNASQGPVDVRSGGCIFSGLEGNTVYRIIVVVQYSGGYAVKQIVQSTGAQAPVMKSLVVTGNDSDSISFDMPCFSTAGSPLPSVTAYIGIDGVIHSDGAVITNSVEGPVDVSRKGYLFSGLNSNSIYRIIVVAQNSAGYSVREVIQGTDKVAPVLNNVIISGSDTGSITIEQPFFSVAGNPSPSVLAYLGLDGVIGVSDGEVTGFQQGPVDVSSSGNQFSGLETNTAYRIVIIARNETGYSVKEIVQSTDMLAPVLNSFSITGSDTKSITISRPDFSIAGNPLPEVNAYIGFNDSISVSGSVVSGSVEGPVNVSTGGYQFNGLKENSLYRVVVVARNQKGYSVQQMAEKTRPDAAEIFLNAKSTSMISGNGYTYKFSAVIIPSDAPSSVTWTSSNENVATVDSNGLVTPLASGNVNITVTTYNGHSAQTACTVNADTNQFSYTVSNSEITISRYTGADSGVIIPSTVAGYPVTAISDQAFFGNTTLSSVEIPSGIETIGFAAFMGCTGLKNITIPSSVTGVGWASFNGCTGLENVTIEPGVESISGEAFKGCTGLTSITIPSSVTSIGSEAFSGCDNLVSIEVDPDNLGYQDIGGVVYNKAGTTLSAFPGGRGGAYTVPYGVTNIGWCALRYCKKLTSVTIPSSVTSIEGLAFDGCTGLQSVIIPSGVASIGVQAFSGCFGLVSLTILGNITAMGEYAFLGCSSLTSVTISENVKVIGDRAFQQCTKLTAIEVDPGNTSYQDINGVLFNKTGSELIAFPGGLGGGYTIPDGVEVVSPYSFIACSKLTSVIIPQSVSSIGGYAFNSCNLLANVTVHAAVPPLLGTDAFQNTNAGLSIKVPSASLSAYLDPESTWEAYQTKISGY